MAKTTSKTVITSQGKMADAMSFSVEYKLNACTWAQAKAIDCYTGLDSYTVEQSCQVT
jgi:hypothetical protein